MENESLTCGVCYIPYDTHDHAPRILMDCGHTLCSSCLTKILDPKNSRKCPFDNLIVKEQQNSPLNFALLALLEGKQKELCRTHGQELTIFCYRDKTKVCYDCALFGEHQGHKIKKIKELKAEGLKMKKRLEESLTKFEKNQLEHDQRMETYKTRILKKSRSKFEEIKKALTKKELEWKEHVERLFKSNVDSSLKEETTKAIEEIDQAFQKEENLIILAQDFNFLISDLQPQVPIEEGGVSRMVNALDFLLTNQANSINNLDLMNEELFKVKQKKTFKTVNTMLLVERFKKSLFVWIKSPNRVDQTINIGVFDSLETIQIRLDHYRSLFQDRIDLDFLSFLLQNFIHYTSLIVDFTPLDLETRHSLTLFPILFCRIEYLIEIQICFKDCKIAIDESIKFLCEGILPRAISLEFLTLKLGWTALTDSSLSSLALALSLFDQNLEIFTLGAQHTKITDAGIEEIIYAVEGVKELRLYLSGTEVTDRSLELLGERLLPELENLETFSLDVSKTKITIKGIKAIFRGVPMDIENLSLSFEGIKLPDEVIYLFEEEVCPKLKFVNDVHLRLEGRDLKAMTAQILERVRNEAEERKKAQECKQEYY